MSVRVAIIGTGWGVRIQVPRFRERGLEIAALYGRTEETVAKYAKELNIPFYTTNFDDIVSRPDIELVSIVMPPHLHKEMTLKSIQAGKHVLCDKPTALNTQEALDIVTAAQTVAQKRLVAFDHELRCLPQLITLREYSSGSKSSEYIGSITHVHMEVQGGSRLAESYRYNWWSERKFGGGVLGAIASHLIDSQAFLTKSVATRVTGTLSTFIKQRLDENNTLHPVTSDDYCCLQLENAKKTDGTALEQPILTTVLASMVTAGPPVHTMRVSGTLGTVWFDGCKVYGSKRGSTTATVLYEDHVKPSDNVFSEATGHLATVLKNRIIRCKESGVISSGLDKEDGYELATAEDALYVQKVLDAAHQSQDNKNIWVDI